MSHETAIYRLLAALCMVYGGFKLLLIRVPNRPVGRLCFVFCGGVMFAVGAVLYRISQNRAGIPAPSDHAAAEA